MAQHLSACHKVICYTVIINQALAASTASGSFS